MYLATRIECYLTLKKSDRKLLDAARDTEKRDIIADLQAALNENADINVRDTE